MSLRSLLTRLREDPRRPGHRPFASALRIHSTGAARSLVTCDWRTYDVAESMPSHAKLLNEVGLLKMMPYESATRASDLRFSRQLQSEITH